MKPMLLTENDYSFVQAVVDEQYVNITENHRNELVAEAIIYLADHPGSRVNSQEVLRALAEHLSKCRRRQQKENAGKSSSERPSEELFSQLPQSYDHPGTDEDKLSRAMARSRGANATDKEEWERIFSLSEKEELEQSQEIFRKQRNRWRSVLPLAEYEAFELMTEAGQTPRWTIGIGQVGIRMLFRRAQIRMLWRDVPHE
jgi:hypothetical protein